MANKLSVTVFIIGLALVALLINIFFIQKNNSEEYNKIVLSQRQSEYESRTIPYRRGDIYDRNGSTLATSEKVYIMILDPKQMISYEGRKEDGSAARSVVEPTISMVSDFFGIDAAELRKTINDNPNSSYIRYMRDISYDKKLEFEAAVEEKNADYAASTDSVEGKKRIKGIWFEDNFKRNYPYGALACNVIGIAAADGASGSGGVEQYYNENLIGINRREYGYLDDDANLEKVIKPAVDGDSLVLTIDVTIQNAVEKYLSEWKNGDIGSKSAACIVMNPKNGEVLAMASTNSFDLNDPRTTGDYTEEEIYKFGINEAVSQYKIDHPELPAITTAEVPEHYTREEIMKFGETIATYQVWRNIPISDTFEPGSTQKIFTVAGALEENIISNNASFECTGHVTLSDGVNTWKINCVNRNGHGLLDVTGGITNSCNVVMMNIAFAEKAETFVKYERTFGFGQMTGIDLPAEANTESLGFASSDIGRTQLATNSFGQNFNCTMIQMAAAYCSVLNGGYYYRPHVVKQILSSDGALKEDIQPLLVRETVSASTCDFLKQALVETVENGTGKAAKVEGYVVGGKTGTAQKQPRSAKTYVVSFCGFAPADDPSLLCYVIVDEPNLPGEEAAHSSFASNIFSKIMAEALPAMNIYPEGNVSEIYQDTGITLPDEEGDSMQPMGVGTSGEQETESKGIEIISNNNGEPVVETIDPSETVSATASSEEYIQGEDDGSEIPELNFERGTGSGTTVSTENSTITETER
ncbi:MAG: penicillin-binding protein 2 [Eubacteriales bacterium]|nr:penicillin-binding protein 2 [Eubacteriales bacterium]